MAYVKSRKHPAARRLNCSAAVALAFIALPGVIHAQQTKPASAKAATEATLPEVNVQGQAQSYKSDQVSSPKFTQPLVDTPQTISIIKKEVFQEQGATTLTDALRNTPGVTMLIGEGGNTSARGNITMRGFDTAGSIFVDGMRDLGNFPRDIYNTEQIEVIKGPSGSEYGRGAPSGTVNMSSKAPFAGNLNAGSLSAGTDKQKRATVDLNRKLNESSAFRINAMAQDSGMPGRDVAKNKGWAFAPSFAFGLNTPTRTFLSLEHIEQRNRPDFGVPTVGLPGYYNAALAAKGIVPPSKVNPKNFYGSTSDFENVNGDMVTARIEHDISPGTILRNTTRIAKVQHEWMATAPSSAVSDGSGSAAVARPDPNTWTATRSRQTKWQKNELITNQTNLTTEFKTGSVAHTLSTGVEFIYEKQLSKTITGAGTMEPANLWNPNPSDPISGYALTPNGAQNKGDTMTVSLYAFDTLKLSEQWQLSGGVRFDRYSTENNNVTVAGVRTRLKGSDTLAGWKLGALYKPASNGSIYTSVSTSQQPPGGSNFTLSESDTNINNPNLEPQKATNVEVGTKWDVLDNKLAVTAAVYRSENTNDLTTRGADPGQIIQYGKKRVSGVELGVVGNITNQWAVSAGLAKMSTKVVAGSAAQTGASLNWSPELTFTAWTTYKLASGLTIGGGARYVDGMVRSVSNTANAATTNMLNVPSYWVYDAVASYNINQNLALRLNLYNLFDKEYVASLNNNGNRYTPGGARAALLTANLKF